MGFGLRMNGHPAAEIREKVANASRILKLDDYLDRKPAALSGGQQIVPTLNIKKDNVAEFKARLDKQLGK